MPPIQLDDDNLYQLSDEEEELEDNFGLDPEESSEDEEDEDGDDGQSDIPLGGSAEFEIEGDFDRLVQNIRQPTGPSDVLSREWDISIEEQEAEFRDDLRAASGVGKRKAGSRRRGRKRGVGPPLSSEVKSLLGEGNQAYVDANIQEATRVMQEVIRIEPRAVQAWSVLAQCYQDLGDGGKALRTRIMAAHLRHDAEEWERLAIESRQLGYKQQAMYCYRKLYSLDPDNVDAIWDRAALAKEVGDLRTARNSHLSILKRFPHDIAVLEELRPVLVELSDLELCAKLFREAFEHYSTVFPTPVQWNASSQDPNIHPALRQPQPSTSQQPPPFTALHLLVLADLYNTLGAYEDAIHMIRRGTRWLQGRRAQMFWDACEDDREFDIMNTDGSSSATRHASHQNADLAPGGYPLDVNARHRLAVARIKMGDSQEGMMHAHIVLSNDILDYAPLFIELADAYFDREMWAEAKAIYEILGADAVTSSIYVLLQTAACLKMMGELKEAAEVYQHVIHADSANNDAKMKLAELFEIMNEPRRALELVYEVIASRKRVSSIQDSKTALVPDGVSLFEEQGKKKSSSKRVKTKIDRAHVQEMETQKEREAEGSWKRVRELWKIAFGSSFRDDEGSDSSDRVEHDEYSMPGNAEPTEAEREWLVEAEKLVEMYRETRALFTTARGTFKGVLTVKGRSKKGLSSEDQEESENNMLNRLQLDMEMESTNRRTKAEGRSISHFRGVSFTDWLRLFLQYTFLLTRRGQYAQADEILQQLLSSNPYLGQDMQVTLRLALITIAIQAHAYSTVVSHVRKIILPHQFNNEPQRILLASLSAGLHPTEAFITSTLQKHISREVRIADAAVRTNMGEGELVKWNAPSKRWVPIFTSGAGGRMGNGAYVKNAEEDIGDDEDDDNREDDSHAETASPIKPLPNKGNPLLTAVYGQICVACRSYQSGLFYLLHAYEHCPEDPMICLSLAIASIGRAMQRQADNRHHLIVQGIGFLSQYRAIRKQTAEEEQEVEYNFGRAFHQLGLYSLAVRHYESVLELAEKHPSKCNGPSKEAAYNLSMIFVFTGAKHLAHGLYRRWLSI